MNYTNDVGYSYHTISNEQQCHSIEVCRSAHVALRMLLTSAIKLRFLTNKNADSHASASKLHKHRVHVALLSDPTGNFIYFDSYLNDVTPGEKLF